MIAEIHNKNVETGSEDQLTGDVFGALRYLPYPVARRIIVKSVFPANITERLLKALPSETDAGWGRSNCGQAAQPLNRYWGLKRVTGYEVPLSEINADNAYEKIFGTFRELEKQQFL
ncbi:MAG: hypothetical protein ACOX7P_06480 [Oscillospiraceae bacterium]|jgi:hypothetical protein